MKGKPALPLFVSMWPTPAFTRFQTRLICAIGVIAIGLIACNTPAPSPTPIVSLRPTDRPRPTITDTLPPTATPTHTPAPASTAAPTPTPDPFEPFTIDQLRARSYDTGPVEIAQTLESNAQFTRYLIAYPSDGLRITGMMDVPNGHPDQRYPVIILNHGYIDPVQYVTGSDTRANADYLARAGYLTLSPDYRGYAGSDGNPNDSGAGVRGENTFRVGFAIDVLNLLHAVPSLPQADPNRLGLWGHSMGGGITLKVLTVDRGASIKAAVLYGAMSGDEAQNLRHIDQLWARGIYTVVAATYGAPDDHPDDYARISPINYLADIAAPISLHHGTADDQVPIEWSRDLYRRLQGVDKTVELFEYNGAGHTFSGEAWLTFMQRVRAFFDQHVNNINP